MLTIAPDGIPYRCRFCHQPVALEFGQGIAASGAIRYFELDEKTVHQCRERKASNPAEKTDYETRNPHH